MSGEHVLTFGSHKDKTLLEVSRIFPSYLLWIGGVTTKYSVTKHAQEFHAKICQENADDVQAVKDFIQDRCRGCWEKLAPDQKHECKQRLAKAEKNYHYHPYGKRT